MRNIKTNYSANTTKMDCFYSVVFKHTSIYSVFSSKDNGHQREEIEFLRIFNSGGMLAKIRMRIKHQQTI